MVNRSAYAVREQALDETEARLASAPDIIDLRFDRARLLTELGRGEEAKQAYLDILARDPAHFGALNNLGVLLHATGFRTAARTVYAETIARHPGNPKGYVNFANALLDHGDLTSARAHYETALRLMPDCPEAHQGLTKLYAMRGDKEQSLWHQHLGFGRQPVITLPYRGEGMPLPVVLVISGAGGNLPIRQFLDDRVFLVSVIVAEFFDPARALPPHRLVINAIGDADLCRGALEAAEKIIAGSTAPVINPPLAVLATGRVMNADRLASIENLITPRAATMQRAHLENADALSMLAGRGFAFPLLLRTPGYHGGKYFVRVEHGVELTAALKELPGAELTVLQYLDASGQDQKIRKYRVMMIGGRLYPVHAAISRQWKVHYFSADMAGHPEHRAEDAAFLKDMPGVLGPKAMQVLNCVCGALGLDYAGIDFGLTSDGGVILFEANATMIVTPPELDDRWAYRSAPIERIFEAVRKMFADKAERAQAS